MTPTAHRAMIAAIACGALACVRPGSASASGDGAATRDTVPVIALERGSCYGTCPVYAVHLFANGRVHFVGTRFTTPVGEDSARVKPAAVAALQAAFRASAFSTVPSNIEPGGPVCGVYVTDVPTVALTVHDAGTQHSVRYYQGCRGYPHLLDTLADMVDSVSGAARWTVRKPA